MSYSYKNVNQPNLEGKRKDNLKVDLKKMSSKKLMDNAPIKIKDVRNYYKNMSLNPNYFKIMMWNIESSCWEKQSLRKEEFLESNENEFDFYSDDDTECNSSADFDKYYLERKKHSNYEETPYSEEIILLITLKGKKEKKKERDKNK